MLFFSSVKIIPTVSFTSLAKYRVLFNNITISPIILLFSSTCSIYNNVLYIKVPNKLKDLLCNNIILTVFLDNKLTKNSLPKLVFKSFCNSFLSFPASSISSDLNILMVKSFIFSLMTSFSLSLSSFLFVLVLIYLTN